MTEKKLDLALEFIRAAVSLATKKEVDHLLFVSDLPPTEEMIKTRSPVRKKLIQAVTSEAQKAVYDAMGTKAVILPAYDLPPHEKTKIALAAGMSEGWFHQGEVVLALVAKKAAAYPDTALLVSVGDAGDPSTPVMLEHAGKIPTQVMESVLSLAMAIAEEGWEGHPIGTIMVVGDSTRVLEKSRQLTLNPFQGYSESEKNIHNPRVREAIKNFAVLDGAFVIREDGVVLAAGRYLNFEAEELSVPLGLGARHMAAAGITEDCEAIAVVVSQTSGVVSVFERGRVVMRLDSRRRRAWSATDRHPEQPKTGSPSRPRGKERSSSETIPAAGTQAESSKSPQSEDQEQESGKSKDGPETAKK